ncbi:MAG: beta-ribofuranosylaminobenzene 5'-phosphate synthase, partial [Candidatus Bathyarchaeia archaeon]
HPVVADTIQFMLKQGASGVGMSSVGPCVYAIARSKNEGETLTTRTREFLNSNRGGEVLLTKPQNTGAHVEIFDS